jgi:ribosomal-protein-alanine acetyltransferase
MSSSLPPIQIRPAAAEDFEAILAIEKLSFHRQAWDLRALKKYECLVAVSNVTVIGFLMARQLVPSSPTEAGEREILNLAVHPSHRGIGAGKLLLAREVAQGGHHFLEVRESNQVARTLYQRAGFVEIGKREKYYHDPVETAIVMQRK